MDYLREDDALDRDLVRKAQGGDQKALEELIRRHQPWVLHIAHRMLWGPPTPKMQPRRSF